MPSHYGGCYFIFSAYIYQTHQYLPQTGRDRTCRLTKLAGLLAVLFLESLPATSGSHVPSRGGVKLDGGPVSYILDSLNVDGVGYTQSEGHIRLPTSYSLFAAVASWKQLL